MKLLISLPTADSVKLKTCLRDMWKKHSVQRIDMVFKGQIHIIITFDAYNLHDLVKIAK